MEAVFARVIHLLYRRRGVGARSAHRRAARHGRLCIHSDVHHILSGPNGIKKFKTWTVKSDFSAEVEGKTLIHAKHTHRRLSKWGWGRNTNKREAHTGRLACWGWRKKTDTREAHTQSVSLVEGDREALIHAKYTHGAFDWLSVRSKHWHARNRHTAHLYISNISDISHILYIFHTVVWTWVA
jgi:hypothetical protein